MELKDNFLLTKNAKIQANSKLSLKSKRRLEHTKAYNTIRSYAADWNDFSDWCQDHKMTDLPAEPETIVNYINDLADNAKANTVSRRITAISENHIAAGLGRDNPAHSGLVRNAMMAIRREKGTFQHGKAPILLETIHLLADCFDDNDIVSLRDRAVLFLGFAGAFRRSELVNVQLEDLTFSSEGVVIFIPQSKGDQLGHGNYIAIPYAPNPHFCAVHAIEQWVLAAQLQTGPLFRPFKKNKELRDVQLSDKSVALIVKKYIKKAGLNEANFAGHSLRRGFATSAAQHDIDALTIMRQTRHKSEKMVHRYIEQGNMFKENPLNRMFNKR
jgi:site-specific recombinase XerD